MTGRRLTKRSPRASDGSSQYRNDGVDGQSHGQQRNLAPQRPEVRGFQDPGPPCATSCIHHTKKPVASAAMNAAASQRCVATRQMATTAAVPADPLYLSRFRERRFCSKSSCSLLMSRPRKSTARERQFWGGSERHRGCVPRSKYCRILHASGSGPSLCRFANLVRLRGRRRVLPEAHGANLHRTRRLHDLIREQLVIRRIPRF